MVRQLKRFLIGRPIPTEHQAHERLDKRTALAVFSSDALSSVAYATEAILAVLIAAGSTALGLSIPIAITIGILLVIVAFSYRQTIYAYSQGGGSYLVARGNLGDTPALIAAASLLIDYVLTVAVSVSAGVAAITSLATTWHLPDIHAYAVPMALFFIALVALINLRGVRESGFIFAIPTYVFLISVLIMVALGIFQLLGGTLQTLPHPPVQEGPEVGVAGFALFWLMLRAFAAGCTALTGIEAISDGVPTFKPPESKNAAITLGWMAALLVTMFLGITWLAQAVNAHPDEILQETVISQIGRTIFGVGPMYVILQIATALILILAANTAFADFPRLVYILARDRFMPRQFSNRGDRLVFSNGIIVLAIFAGILVWIFNANEIHMLPLYAIGVFTSFTISQSGMVRRWFKIKSKGWQLSMIVNAIGAVLTGVVLVVLALTKFLQGAWIVLVLMPILVTIFRGIHWHYSAVADRLSLANEIAHLDPVPHKHKAVVLVGGMHRGTLPALQYARSIAPDDVTGIYVEVSPEATERVLQRWKDWCPDLPPLVVLRSPYRSLIRPILHYIADVERSLDGRTLLTVVVPEFVPGRWWEHLLHNQTGFMLKTALMVRRETIVASIPYHLDRLHPLRPSQIRARPMEHPMTMPLPETNASGIPMVSPMPANPTNPAPPPTTS